MRKRSTYRPRPVWANAVQMAIEGARRPSALGRLKVHAAIAEALDEYPRGVRCAHHWRTLADACNVAETFDAMGVRPLEDTAQVINAAQQALYDVAERATGPNPSWTLRSAEMAAVRAAMALHEDQLEQASRAQWEQAYDRTRARVEGARRGQAARGTRVVEAPMPVGAA